MAHLAIRQLMGGRTALLVLAIVAGAWWLVWGGFPTVAGNGKQLYAQNCASCHGANLQGEPDWQITGEDGILPAPPHDETGHTWHHGDRLLFDYTKLGGAAALQARGVSGFNSGMPAFGETLSNEEIRQVLTFVKSTWSPREQAVQNEATLAE